MKLRTYRINQKQYNLRRKLEFLDSLYWSILNKDNFWHYFFDPEGATLRFSPKFEEKVKKWLDKNKKSFGLTYRRRNLYDPSRHEYYGIKFLGEPIAILFHDLSVLMVLFPPRASFWPALERLNHGFVNMTGIHDFIREANMYLDLAYDRASLTSWRFPFPKWLYKLYFKFLSLFKK